MYILAIDTSCDETAVAITNNDVVLANVISSQVELHKKWGGVVPSLAQRAHRERIDQAIKEALQRAQLELSAIDLFAVTYGPGLAIALEVGVAKAKELAKQYSKPLLAVNHMTGHLYANLAKTKTGQSAVTDLQYPALALLISGNHTEIVLLKGPFDYQIIGATLDDALGEAYDKVARMLSLGYPGGPIIAELAKSGNPTVYPLPIPMRQSGDLNFSFSGLKTAVLHTIKRINPEGQLNTQQTKDVAAAFQQAAITSISQKLTRALTQYPVTQVILGGGVVANQALRQTLRKITKKAGAQLIYPNLKKLCTDNAAMIAVAAYYQWQAGHRLANPEQLDRDPIATVEEIGPR